LTGTISANDIVLTDIVHTIKI